MKNYIKLALEKNIEDLKQEPLEPVTVAVVDSGIYSSHPDLAGRISSAWSINPSGESLEVEAIKVSDNDVYGHGTGVAGIIAQIAPNANIIDIRVLDISNCCKGETLLEGFRLAIEKKARLINLSLACREKFAHQLHDLCETAYRNNQIVIAARRNMPFTDNGFPAELSACCIPVDMSNVSSPYQILYRPGHPIEYVAKGEGIVTAAKGGGYTTVTGTSFATPTITGICSLFTGAFPKLRLFEIKTILKALSIL